MEEKYPIVSDGNLVGELTVSREGLMTVFDATCRMVGDIVRLSVYGKGAEGYLGVMAPSDGKLRLRKVLSPNAMKAMPSVIEEVAFSGRSAVPVIETEAPELEGAEAEEIISEEIEEEAVEVAETEPPEIEETEVEEVSSEDIEENTVGVAQTQPVETVEVFEQAKGPEAADPREIQAVKQVAVLAARKNTYWYPSADGALVSYDGDKSLIAFPVGDTRVPDYIKPIEKTIEGTDYWVYVTQDGRIIN